MPEQYKALQGFKDILPDERPYWRMVERVAIEVANIYGYRRIETPLLEETAIFLRTSGEGTDIVEKEMYTFDDRPDKEGNRTSLTLRPEGTAGVVRAYLEAEAVSHRVLNLGELEEVIRRAPPDVVAPHVHAEVQRVVAD